MKKILLKKGLVFSGCGFERTDMLIVDGKIAKIATRIHDDEAEEINLMGLYVLPGLVDVHVHLREPGFEYKETIETGTKAAAHSGYTDIFSMPNLSPAPDTVENVKVQLKAIDKDAVIHVHPYGCITMGQKGEGNLVDFDSLKDYVAGFSDDGRGVQSDDLMREAMKKCKALGKTIVAHCEVNSLLNGGYIHDGVYASENGHKGICSESEWRQVERDINLVRETGCSYHVCHISTKESVDLIRKAKAEGLPVTCETAPHYLILCDEDLKEDGAYKMNPPLRSKADKEALIEGIIDGTIDCNATDHAPHSLEEKSKGLKDSAFGISGLEIAFPLMFTHFVKENKIPVEKLVQLMSINPRRIMGLKPYAIGEDADLAVFNIIANYTIEAEKFISLGKSTPFNKHKVETECVGTLIKGEFVYRTF